LGRDPEIKPEHVGAQLITDAACGELEALFGRNLRAAAADGRLLAQPGLMQTLREWLVQGGEAEVRAWTARCLTDDASALRLAAAAIQVTRSQGSGDWVVQERPVIYRATLAKFIDVDALTARIDAIAAASPSQEALLVIEQYRLGLESKAGGRRGREA
jgi:hypothetical protein